MSGQKRVGWLGLLQRSPATLAIAGVTTAFFLIEFFVMGSSVDPANHARLGAMRPDRVLEHAEYYRLIMPVFLHHGPVHLVLNGLAFLQLGALTEYLYGWRRMVAFYFLCGVSGTLASLFFMDAALGGSLGASGAIMGLAGLLLGASWYGEEPWRTRLRQMFGRRLWFGVGLTFFVGIAINMAVPMIDNWAHAGGFFGGMLLAGVFRDPDEIPGSLSRVAAVAAMAVWAFAIGWMAWDGDEALASFNEDLAAGFEARAAKNQDGVMAALYAGKMVEQCHEAGIADTCAPRFEALVANMKQPMTTQVLVGALFQAGHDAELTVVLNRWIELAPDEPEALNAMAWHMVTRRDAAHDPGAAEPLSRRSLALIEQAGGDDVAEAAYRDTLAEILYQQGHYDEALKQQQQAVALAEAGQLSQLGELQARLAKIRQAIP